MVRRRKNLSDDDRILWKKVTSTVSPISGGSSIFAKVDEPAKNIRPTRVASSAKSKNIQVKRSARDHQLPDVPSPLLSFTHQPHPQAIDPKTRKKIDRGRVPIEAKIDLHGMIQSSAHTALRGFLLRARSNNCRLVLVITGKGEAGTGILRHQVPHWLTSGELATIVSGFQEAHRNHGGSGALYVRLRRLK